MTKSSLINDF